MSGFTKGAGPMPGKSTTSVELAVSRAVARTSESPYDAVTQGAAGEVLMGLLSDPKHTDGEGFMHRQSIIREVGQRLVGDDLPRDGSDAQRRARVRVASALTYLRGRGDLEVEHVGTRRLAFFRLTSAERPAGKRPNEREVSFDRPPTTETLPPYIGSAA